MKPLIIFDFDGVIADSELLANEELALLISEIGLKTTREQSCELYMGKRLADYGPEIERRLGRPLPDDFAETLHARTMARFADGLQPVPGVLRFLERFEEVARCIASSSSPARLSLCLEVLGLADRFGDHVFSATQVKRGKPFPDIFLHAAHTMAFSPEHCLVIEDSASGVAAGLGAGMKVLGLAAGSHAGPDHMARLAEAGAHKVALNFDEAAEHAMAILEGMARSGQQGEAGCCLTL